MRAPDVTARLAEAGPRAWLDSGSRIVRYRELGEFNGKLAALLKARGVEIGDRVVVATRDDAEAALLFVGLFANGVTVVNLDADTARERAQALIGRARPSLIVLDAALAERWALGSEYGAALTIDAPPAQPGLLKAFMRPAPRTGFHAELEAAGVAELPSHIPDETLAYILFTSGTTKQPKGVCISHRALFAHLATLSRTFGYDGHSVIFNSLMLSHADGMIQGPVIAWYNLATLHRPFAFEVGTIERMMDAIYQLRVTHLVAVPTMLALMTRLGGARSDAFQGGDFRLLISCGAALEPELWQAVEREWGVSLINVYGLTETVVGGVFASDTLGSGVRGSIGKPIDCALRIVDEQGRELAAGDAGELLIHGELLMSGYFDDPEHTAEVLRDGWFRTGDIASRDDDNVYFIQGRSKNIVIRGGLNIHPEEISEALARHPAVRAAVAFGIPDADWGERLVALAVTDGADEAELQRHCTTLLEPRKVPNRIRIVDALPLGRSGKVVLDEARAMFGEALPEAPSAAPGGGDDAERLIAIAASCFKVPAAQFSLASRPEDVLGWDSLAHMEFVVAVEREFGCFFTPRQVMGIDRLSSALEFIRAG